MTTKLFALLAVLTAVLALSGCGEDGAANGGEIRTAANGDRFNDADVAFASDMIQHHAQALEMVDLTVGRELSPQITQLAEEIRAAQGPEIEQMVDWLTAWDEPVPETSRDHAHAHGDGGMEGLDQDMPGMMSEQQMTDLEEASGAEFETLWLEMMIQHHQGAIEMARVEQADGAFEPAVALAEDIETQQQEEIELMEDLRGS